MLNEADTEVYPDLFFDTQCDGVRVSPGIRNGSICIEYVKDHFIHRMTLESGNFYDSISAGALEWLYKQNGDLQSTVHTLSQVEQDNVLLKDENARLKQQIFGTSSEQAAKLMPETPPAANDELPCPPAVPDEEPAEEKVREISKRGRKPLPPHLPRERISYELPKHDQFCSCCHGGIEPIGEEVTEQLTVIPAQFKVLQHVRKKYVCRHCGIFVTAPGAPQLIEKSSYASPDFLAHVASNKYQYGLPFYRQEHIFATAGLPINRTTLANLMIGSADKLSALHEALRQELLRQRVIHADETEVQVLKEEGRAPQNRSFLWLYCSGIASQRQVVLFDYQMTRAGKHPRNFLSMEIGKLFTGYLQVDGYAGYNQLPPCIIRVGCLVHVRRKFCDVIKTLPDHVNWSPAHYAVQIIGRLYEIERRIKGLPRRVRYRTRQEQSVPILKTLKTWLDDMGTKVAPKTSLGKAVTYALNQWYAVCRYVDDGDLSIDNNIAERSIKSVVIGRKNWLFADSSDGMHTNAVMYSLVETARANGIDPFAYLRYVIKTMPTLRTAAEIECLLPWNMPLDENLAKQDTRKAA